MCLQLKPGKIAKKTMTTAKKTFSRSRSRMYHYRSFAGYYANSKLSTLTIYPFPNREYTYVQDENIMGRCKWYNPINQGVGLTAVRKT